VRWLGVPVPFIGLEVREQQRSGSNRWQLSGASRRESFGFDLAPRGTGNEETEPGEGVDASGRRDGYPKCVGWRFQSGQRRRLDDRRRKMVGERARIGPKVEWVGCVGPKRKLGGE
jgi:hypothetical protein